MQPHYSQSSRENETPSSGTSPLTNYKEVPPPRGGGRGRRPQYCGLSVIWTNGLDTCHSNLVASRRCAVPQQKLAIL